MRPILRSLPRTLLPLLLASLLPVAAHAMSRMGEVAVRSHDGVPCFSITFKERWTNGVPLVIGMSVYAYQAGRIPDDVWSFRLPLERRIKVDTSVCLPYGAPPEHARAEPAPVLQLWQLYGVSLHGRTERSSDGTVAYSGRFCLVPRGAGGVEIIDMTKHIRGDRTTCQDWIQPLP